MTKPPRRRRGAPLQHLQRLRVQERWAPLLPEASAQERTAADGRDRLLTAAGTATEDQQGTMRPVMARFPDRTTVESGDVGFQPAVARQTWPAWATGRVIEPGDHVVFWGPPGTGTTHLAIALGLQAVPQR